MTADGTDGEPFPQDDPIDLDADHPWHSPADTALAAAFRAELEPDEQQTHRMIARLPLIQARARRRHRLHQVLTSGLAVVAVVGVATATSALPPAHRATVVSPAGASSSTEPVPATSWSDAVDPTLQRGKDIPANLPSALTSTSVRNFAGLRLIDSMGDLELGAQPMVTGVCGETRVKVATPELGLHSRWPVKTPSDADPRPAGLSEKWWSWENPASAPAAYQRLAAQVAGCSTRPGRDGRSATRRLDAPELAQADKVLVTTASDGQKNQAIQMVVLTGDMLLQLDAVIPADGRKEQAVIKDGMRSLTPLARLALTRLHHTARTASR